MQAGVRITSAQVDSIAGGETKQKVSSLAIAPYTELVKRLARPYVGRFDSESDDLEQEGLIKVFQALSKGKHPAKEHIRHGMRDWVRTMEYQTRYRRMNEVSLEEYQAALLEQEEQESVPFRSDVYVGGLDYIDGPGELY